MATQSLPKTTVAVPFESADLDELREVSGALESILWMCEKTRDEDRTAGSVHFLLGPWDSRLATLIEKLDIRLRSVSEGGAA